MRSSAHTMRTFTRVYFAVAALTLVACTCLPWLVPLSYRLLGFEPELAYADGAAAIQAHAATASLRRDFIFGVLLLALCLIALSIAGLILRARRRTDLSWVAVVLTTLLGAAVAVIAVAALLSGAGGMCC